MTLVGDARAIPAVVSTDWLEAHLDDADLVVVDVREPEAYEAGHVPGAVNRPPSTWAGSADDLLFPLPGADELFDLIGAAGIGPDARVVVVGAADDTFPLADPMKVADTLLYGGLADVAVLDGGFDAWVAEDRPTDDEPAEPAPVDYSGDVDEGMFVTKAELLERLDEVPVVDAREPEAYFGEIQEPFTDRPGHIPGAACLPAPWIWTEEGTFKPIDELEAFAEGVVGEDRSAEVVLYCGASPFSASWRFVLRELLGYENARVYNGAAQEWTMDPEAPLTRHAWE